MTYDDFLKDWFNDCDHILAHTSGSTGCPKEISLVKADMRLSAQATNRFFSLSKNSVIATPLSADYIAGKMMCVRALEAGARFLPLENSNSFEIPNEHIDLLAVVPSQVSWLIENKESASKIRYVLVGGAELPEFLKTGLIKAGYTAYESYGMTETCSHVALRRVGKAKFRAMPGVSFEVDDQSCLIINIPHFTINHLQTNDVVSLHSPSSFTWRGRRDNVINSGGIKIHSEELEKQYALFFPHLQFFLTSAPHPKWGQALAMVFVGTQDDAANIAELLNDKFPHTHTPKFFHAVKELPRTENGKIKREIPKE